MSDKGFGMSAQEAEAFIRKELAKIEAQTTFYWNDDRLDEVLDAVVKVMAQLIEANGEAIKKSFVDQQRRAEMLGG